MAPCSFSAGTEGRSCFFCSVFFRTLLKVYVSAQVSRYSGIHWQGKVLWGPGVEIRVDPWDRV